MKVACKARQNVVWPTVARLVAGVMVLLWLARWFVRLMPRAIGGDRVFAWSELAERAYRAVNR